jgi:hypothetical protein
VRRFFRALLSDPDEETTRATTNKNALPASPSQFLHASPSCYQPISTIYTHHAGHFQPYTVQQPHLLPQYLTPNYSQSSPLYPHPMGFQFPTQTLRTIPSASSLETNVSEAAHIASNVITQYDIVASETSNEHQPAGQ